MDDAPIPLNAAQLDAIRTWAEDTRLWGSRESAEFNLCTFARLILKHADIPAPPSPVVPAQPDQCACTTDTAGGFHEPQCSQHRYHAMCVCERCKPSLAPSTTAPATTWEANLREYLWLGHGHPFAALYGDDGEMQCSACRVDYKRDSLEQVSVAVIAARSATNLAALAARQEADILNLRRLVEQLIAKWRKDAADLDEATHGTWIEPGVMVNCADELSSLLTETPR